MPSDAVGSLGAEFAQWVRDNRPFPLLPWQEYFATRLLEVDAAGELVHRRGGLSTPRQVGKSHVLRDLILWRLTQEGRFGEPQTVLHVAHALTTTEEVFMEAEPWAREQGWKVRTANGQMMIQAGDSRWLPRSTKTGFGFTNSVVAIDEVWAVGERTVSTQMSPTLDRPNQSQMWLFSSAHPSGTMLYPRFRRSALEARQRWLVMEWSAAPEADTRDVEVWKAATPLVWSRGREESMREALDENEADFAIQWLNQWPAMAGLSWGQKLAGRLVDAPDGMRASGVVMMALECDTNARHWGAAVSDGAVVHVFAGKSLEACWTWLSAWFGQARALLVHRSTVGLLPVPVPVNVELVSPPDHQAATVTLENVIEAGELRVVGDAMSEQLRSAKVSGLSSVHKIDQQVSTGPIPVVKAAAWAIWGAVQNPTHAVQIM